MRTLSRPAAALALLLLPLACSAPPAEHHALEAVLARTPEELHEEALQLLELLDADGDGRLAETELVPAYADLLEGDRDGDGALSLAELEAETAPSLVSLRFEARGTDLVALGLIDGTTPRRLREALDAHPQTRRLVLARVDGSLDQDATYAAGRMVRARGLATHVPADGSVASGGVDLFLAGLRRSAEPGASFGVHSWALDLLDRTLEGHVLPREHPEHELALAFLREIGVPEEYYWFTLEAACSDEIHWMRADELARFAFLDVPDPAVGARDEGEHEDDPLAAVAFLAGGWRCERDGLVFEECWSEPSGGLMLGFGRTLQEGRAIAFEQLRLEAREGAIDYVASPSGGGETRFRLLESAPWSVAFENPAHDDPRRIAYALDEQGRLHARLARELGPAAKPTRAFAFEPAELVPR